MNKLKNIWYVVRFKANEIDIFERNLDNQNFIFYIPKLTKKSKVFALFPVYGFIKHTNIGLNALRYTRGLINIVKFGDNYAFVEEDIIYELKALEEASKVKPIEDFLVGDEISIKSGPFKDYISRIISLPSQDRITVLLNILGSKKSLTFSIDSVKKT